MKAPPESIRRFLDCERIAVAGVSRDPKQTANLIFRKLRGARPQVFAVNPRATEVEGGPCYPNLGAIPGGVEAVMVVTAPDAASEVVRQCAAAGVKQVWFHRAIDQGSLSKEAVAMCREQGITPIVGGCPMMYVPPVDVGHRCMRTVLGWTHKLPTA